MSTDSRSLPLLDCARCGCPAYATSAQVEAARSSYRRAIGLPPLEKPDVMANIEQLPMLLIGAVGVTGDTSDNDEAAALAGLAAAGLTADPS